MPYNKVDIERIIYNFLLQAMPVDVDVVKGRQEKWRDDANYCVYRILPFSDVSQPQHKLVEKTIPDTYELISNYVQDVEVVIDMVGNSAFNNYGILKNALFDEDINADLDFLSLVDYDAQAVDNTALEKEMWLERATGSLTFRFNNEFTKDISTIDEVKDIDFEFISYE